MRKNHDFVSDERFMKKELLKRERTLCSELEWNFAEVKRSAIAPISHLVHWCGRSSSWIKFILSRQLSLDRIYRRLLIFLHSCWRPTRDLWDPKVSHPLSMWVRLTHYMYVCPIRSPDTHTYCQKPILSERLESQFLYQASVRRLTALTDAVHWPHSKGLKQRQVPCRGIYRSADAWRGGVINEEKWRHYVLSSSRVGEACDSDISFLSFGDLII